MYSVFLDTREFLNVIFVYTYLKIVTRPMLTYGTEIKSEASKMKRQVRVAEIKF